MQIKSETHEATMTHLAFIDMDDTLLGPDKKISAGNLLALEKLRGAGVEIVIASGRHHLSLLNYREVIGDLDWFLSSHGAVVRNLRTGELLSEVSLSQDVVEDIVRRAGEEGLSLVAYHRDGLFIQRQDEWTDLHAQRNGLVLPMRDFRKLTSGQFQKVVWTGPADRIFAVARGMEDEFQARARVLRTEAELLEFFSPYANKAAGAQVLVSNRAFKGHTLAFGDSYNDVELLGWADVSVAMAHGCEPARKVAKFISPQGDPSSAFARAVDIALEQLAIEEIAAA